MALTEQQRIYQQQYRLRTNNQSQKRYMQNRADKLANDLPAFARDQLKKLSNGAKERGIAFDLELEDIVKLLESQTHCALSGIELTFRIGCGNKASVDRIDSHGCYELGNVQLVTTQINYMKSNMSDQEFIRLAHAVSQHNSVKPTPVT
jgi:hypothetical protein